MHPPANEHFNPWVLWVTVSVFEIFAETFAKCLTYEDSIRKLTIGANEEDKGGIPIVQVARI